MTEGWVATHLAAVATVNPKERPLPDDAPFVTMADVDEWGTWARTSGRKGSRGGIRAQGGDILVARITPCLENGKIALVPPSFAKVGGSTEFIVLRAGEGLLPEFLFLWAASRVTHASAVALMTGTTGRQRVSGRDIAALPIEVPPVPVQRRIVDVMFHLDSQLTNLRSERDAASAIALEVCDDPASGPPSPLGPRVQARGGKRMPKGESFAGIDTGHAYLRVVDMSDGTFKRDSLEFVPTSIWPQIRRYVVRRGDVVVSIVGTIGRIAVVPKWADGANLTENAAIVDVKDSGLDHTWLAYWLRSGAGQQEIQRVTVGTSQGKLALTRIPLIEIPTITRSRQAELGTTAAAAQELASRLSAEVAALEQVRVEALSAAMMGELAIPSKYDDLLVDVS